MGCKMCQKPTVSYKKGLWSPDEDQKLKDYILKHGHVCWSSVPVNAGLQRNGKSCRLRWINYLRPGLKRSVFTPEEEAVVVKLHSDLGNKWSKIAMHLPGRTDNEVKNHWNTYLKKKVNAKFDDSLTHNSCLESGNGYKKLEQFSDENNSQISLSESLVTSESHSPSSYQSTIHISNSVPELSLPKVLFADWLPVLNGNCHSSSALESTSNSEVLSPELLQFEMIHGLDDSSINGGLQMQIPDASLHDLLFFDEAYTGLELNREMFSNL